MLKLAFAARKVMKHYLNVNNWFSGMLGEIYCQKYLNENNYAYVSLEQIFKDKIKDDMLEFRLDPKRIQVTIPKEIQDEILKLSTPKELFEPHYVYDFLACKIKSKTPQRNVSDLTVNDFIWVEAKSGFSSTSKKQEEAKSETQLKVMKCSCEGVFQNLPKNVGIEFSKL